MKMLKTLFLTLVIAFSAFAAWAYSWTYTAQGRLDFPAAVIAKAASTMDNTVDLSLDTVAEARQAANERMGGMLRAMPVPEGVTISDLQIPGPAGDITLRAYRPEGNGELPAMLWIHGGGFWMGNNLKDWDARVAILAKDAGVAIFSVDYRLAPEHPWPAAVDDCYAALLWLPDQAQSLDIDATRIAIGGGSAGGNLAAVVAMKARDENGPDIAAQLLMVPATDASDRNNFPSEREFAEGYVLTGAGIKAMLEAYLPNPEDRVNPYASPLLARSHEDLPPAIILTAQYDPLRDEGEAYGEKLRAAGVPAKVIRFDGAIHGLMGSTASMQTAHEEQVALLNEVFQQ